MARENAGKCGVDWDKFMDQHKQWMAFKSDELNARRRELQNKSVRVVGLKPTIDGFLTLLEGEILKDSARFNAMTNKREILDGDNWTQWTDETESKLRMIFQQTYGMSNRANLDDALRIYFSRRTVNPLTDWLDGLKWDGKERILDFLEHALKAPATEYTRECSRLIFAGGIHRAYEPGCKFDDVVVLVGKQGGGKSTVVRMLNVDERYFREVKTMTGTESIEVLQGAWICEFSELMAITKAKEMETAKAYITTQEDTYRAPYDRNAKKLPRRCIFLGTTNNPHFLTDKTGNRRFYPVTCMSDGYEVGERTEELTEYIIQCWAEAMARKDEPFMQAFARKELREEILAQQENALEDDWRTAKIGAYLEAHSQEAVCILQLWYEALEYDGLTKPDMKESNQIAKIVCNQFGWVRLERVKRIPQYGIQKAYVKLSESVTEAREPVIVHDEVLPF